MSKKPDSNPKNPEKNTNSNSVRSVTSNQPGTHKNLEVMVKKHQQNLFRQPIAEHTTIAFEATQQWLSQQQSRPLILDTGCGTGMSTLLLAEKHPQCNVIGIDRSIHRLKKSAEERASHNPDSSESVLIQPNACLANACLVRADLVDFWRLAAAANWQLEHHYFLYPNPYPKSKQLQRRWHAHPVFPNILALGGDIVVRSNWLTYLEEFALALQLSGIHATDTSVNKLPENTLKSPLTLFEKKYAADGQPLYQLSASTIKRDPQRLRE